MRFLWAIPQIIYLQYRKENKDPSKRKENKTKFIKNTIRFGCMVKKDMTFQICVHNIVKICQKYITVFG